MTNNCSFLAVIINKLRSNKSDTCRHALNHVIMFGRHHRRLGREIQPESPGVVLTMLTVLRKQCRCVSPRIVAPRSQHLFRTCNPIFWFHDYYDIFYKARPVNQGKILISSRFSLLMMYFLQRKNRTFLCRIDFKVLPNSSSNSDYSEPLLIVMQIILLYIFTFNYQLYGFQSRFIL